MSPPINPRTGLIRLAGVPPTYEAITRAICGPGRDGAIVPVFDRPNRVIAADGAIENKARKNEIGKYRLC